MERGRLRGSLKLITIGLTMAVGALNITSASVQEPEIPFEIGFRYGVEIPNPAQPNSGDYFIAWSAELIPLSSNTAAQPMRDLSSPMQAPRTRNPNFGTHLIVALEGQIFVSTSNGQGILSTGEALVFNQIPESSDAEDYQYLLSNAGSGCATALLIRVWTGFPAGGGGGRAPKETPNLSRQCGDPEQLVYSTVEDPSDDFVKISIAKFWANVAIGPSFLSVNPLQSTFMYLFKGEITAYLRACDECWSGAVNLGETGWMNLAPESQVTLSAMSWEETEFLLISIHASDVQGWSEAA